MSQTILIGVGGSGQNVVSAYLRLSRMAGFTPAPFYIVDSDTKGPQFQGLSELKRKVRRVVGGHMPQRWDINPYPTNQVERKVFGDLFSHPNEDARQLFEALFSEDAEKTPVRTGMYGRPAIGATCMRLKFRQEDDDLRELKQMLRGGEKHVILVGSCFGGTGSGGVPILAEEFQRLNKEPGYSLRVQAVVFLPWFRLTLREGETVLEEKRLHERLNANFEPNAAASINFFKSKIRSLVETVIFLGVRDPSTVARISQESSQGESRHALNLISAVLAQNLFHGDVQAPRGVTGYWYESELGLNPKRLTIARDGKELPPLALTDVIKRASLQQKWSGILKKLFESFWQIPELQRPLFLFEALDRMRGSGTKGSEITGEVKDYLADLEADYGEALEWMDGMEDKDLLPLEAGDKRIQSEEYQEICDNPLPYLKQWSDDGDAASKFEAKDFSRPVVFAEKLTDLFLADLCQHFQL